MVVVEPGEVEVVLVAVEVVEVELVVDVELVVGFAADEVVSSSSPQPAARPGRPSARAASDAARRRRAPRRGVSFTVTATR